MTNMVSDLRVGSIWVYKASIKNPNHKYFKAEILEADAVVVKFLLLEHYQVDHVWTEDTVQFLHLYFLETDSEYIL